MTGTTATDADDIPVITDDLYAPEVLTAPHALHERLREAGPVVRLKRYDVWGMPRYEQVAAALRDCATFSSAAGAGLSDFRKEKP